MKNLTYEVDENCRVVPGPQSSTHNFEKLKALLLSKDLGKDKGWIKNDFAFLDGEVNLMDDDNMVALQSYPRSGSTLLRRLMEQVTGVYTGADEQDVSLANLGLLGQEHTSTENRVWMTKTQSPMQSKTSISFMANKMICLVRNPLDVIASHAEHLNMRSHNLSTAESFDDNFPEWWSDFVK